METIARPFGMLLMFLYDVVNNYGVALILFAIVVRLILLPFQMKSKKGMLRQGKLQPKIAELQKKHGTNKAKLNEEMAKLYKEEGVSPASGCLWGFIPLPIMIVLFFAIREPLTMMLGIPAELLAKDGSGTLTNLINASGFSNWLTNYYEQIAQTQWINDHLEAFISMTKNLDITLRHIDLSFLGLNLGNQPQWDFLWNGNTDVFGSWGVGFATFLLPFLSAGSQFLASGISRKINPAGSPEAGGAGNMKIMMMLMPLISVYFGFIVPAALSLYWLIGTLLQIVQDVVLTKHYIKIVDAEEAVRNEERLKKEAEIEAKRLEAERRKAEGIAADRNRNTSKRKKQKSSKQDQMEKAAEWQKKTSPDQPVEKYEPSRVGNRRFARGRAYNPDRYSGQYDGEAQGLEDEYQSGDDTQDAELDTRPAGGGGGADGFESGAALDGSDEVVGGGSYDDDEYDDDEYDDDGYDDEPDDEYDDDETDDDDEYDDDDDEYDDDDDDDDETDDESDDDFEDGSGGGGSGGDAGTDKDNADK